MVIEVISNLWVGDLGDSYKVLGSSDWSIVHACKEPYHRQELGYTGRAAPKEHPEYLVALRGHRLILNLVDAPQVEYIPAKVIDAALAFIEQELSGGRKVLVHCNQGESRAPGIALLYCVEHRLITRERFIEIYPNYKPGQGMAAFIEARL